MEKKNEREKRRYSLRLFDEELLSFELESRGQKRLRAEILEVNEARRSVFPLDLDVSNEGIMKWLNRRLLPKYLSLNDSYWAVPEDFNGTFAEYNLYENRFSEELSEAAFFGTGKSFIRIPEEGLPSPDWRLRGVLPKAWRYIEGDGIYLYKGETCYGGVGGKEPFSEFYACQVAAAMGIDAVNYELESWRGFLTSRCRLFTSPEVSFVSAGQIVHEGMIREWLSVFDSFGEEYGQQLRSMLVFDAVIYNEDRHPGNFGLLRDSRTGDMLRPAPLFDNGISLFNCATENEFQNLEAYAETRLNPYGVSYEEICRRVCGTKQRAQLRRLNGFHFRRHPDPERNLPEWRLQAIEEQIRRRVRQLLNL